MIFTTNDVSVDFTQPTDVDEIVEVYNSQPAFIRQHRGRTGVTRDWRAEEVKAARDAGFWSCKVVGQSIDRVIGLLDVNIDAETYLSLLMIHQSSARQGMGPHVYRALAAYAR